MNDNKRNVDPKHTWESQKFEHDRQLLDCRFSPCGRFVFAGGTDRLVHRWELATEKKSSLTGHASWICALEFHPDGKRLITADYVGGLRCWNYAEASPKPVWSVVEAHQGAIRSLAISPHGRYFATVGHDQIVRVWSATDGKPLHELAGHGSPVLSAAFHPDGNSLVSGEQHGVVKHWDAATGKHLRDLDASIFWAAASLTSGAQSCGIRSMTFDPSGSTLACAGITELKDGDRRGGNATVLELDFRNGKQKRLYKAKGAGYAERALYHPAGYIIAACLTQERGSVEFWKAGATEPIFKQPSSCRDFDQHPDGARIAVSEWKKVGKAGNNPSTKKLEEYDWHHGVIRILSMTARVG